MSNKYYVSADIGNDSNDGSEMSPYKTIQCAANIAKPGDTILVQPGIYRERVSPQTGGTSNILPITYKSIVPRGAIIRGSTSWQPSKKYTINSGTIYYDTLHPDLFPDKSAVDGGNPFTVRSCVTPYGRNGAPEYLSADTKAQSDPNMIYNLGQVFVNDVMYIQCPYKNEMESKTKTWFYDISKNELYVNLEQSLSESNIEITNQRRVFAPHVRGLKYIIVDGFVIERCGNNYPNQFWLTKENQQAGAIGTRSGKFWTIQNNIIRYANGVGIDWGNEGSASQDLEIGFNGNAAGSYGHVIKNNVICDNGAAGTAAYMAKNVVFTCNIVERNNNLLFYGKRRWESAGMKVHCPTNYIIANNIIRENYGHGIWCDQGAGLNSIIKNNIIVNNLASGINYEIGSSTTGKVLNNIFDDNEYNIYFVTSGGVLVAHNMFLSSKKTDIYTNIFNRTSDKWDSLNIEIYYNVFINSPCFLKLTQNAQNASRYMNFNHYNTLPDQCVFSYMQPDIKKTQSLCMADWNTIWQSSNMMNRDEMSCCNNNLSDYILDRVSYNSYRLQNTNKQKPSSFIYVKNGNIIDDYFGNDWSTDTSGNCIAGPFNLCEYDKPYIALEQCCV